MTCDPAAAHAGETSPADGNDAVIVTPSAEDLPILVELDREIFPPGWDERSWRSLLAQPEVSAWLVSGVQRPVAGFALVRQSASEAEILKIGIASAERQRGVGSLLLGWTLDELARSGVVEVYLEVRANDEAAKRLYDGHGFDPVGSRKAYYADGTDAQILRARLLPSRADR